MTTTSGLHDPMPSHNPQYDHHCQNMRTIALSTFVLTSMFAVASCLLAGCSKDDSPSDEWSSRTGSDFPYVAGTYSFITGPIVWLSSDGQSGSGPPIGFNCVVHQVENNIAVENLSANTVIDAAGITVLSGSDMTGVVDRSGNFTLSQVMRIAVDGFEGTVLVTYNIAGAFTPNGWSGDYRYTLNADIVSVTYMTTFSGDRLM